MGRREYRRAAAKLNKHANQRDQNSITKKLKQKHADRTQEELQANAAALLKPYLDIPADMYATEEYFGDVKKRLYFNDDYANYFEKMAKEEDNPTLKNTARNVRQCHKQWYGEWYGMQRVFDVKSVFLCHNKFCSNCEHILQASRLKRFSPILAELSKQYDVYHFVLTVPNCDGACLSKTMDTLFSAFTKIIRYFSGDAKLRGMDFGQYGYGGAMRCLECTVAKDYHPHLHSILLLKKSLPLYKTLENTYSYSYGVYERSFSELEITLQKMLYLITNRKKVTLAAIEKVPEGYSCTLDAVDGDEWKEAFKYAIKLSKEDNGMTVMEYEQCTVLYHALRRRRVMQGYGALYNIAKDDSMDKEVRKEYALIRATLQLVEVPATLCYDLDELIVDLQKGRYKVISKRAIQRYLNQMAKDGNTV